VTRILGISGSLRRASYNSALLRAATRLMPPEATLEVGSIRGIPLYDGDVEAQGIPAAVSQLKEAIIAADGVLLVTPEYNNSIPGVFKNGQTICPHRRIPGRLRYDSQPERVAAGAAHSGHACLVRRAPHGVARRRGVR
jgi:NAD(P)H-dependent FMN reductase